MTLDHLNTTPMPPDQPPEDGLPMDSPPETSGEPPKKNGLGCSLPFLRQQRRRW